MNPVKKPGAGEAAAPFVVAPSGDMQKALTFMNIQLHHVISTITGVTGMRIIRAIVAGERDPDKLAAMRDVRCKESSETIRSALGTSLRVETSTGPLRFLPRPHR
jgi:hypothetical protein